MINDKIGDEKRKERGRMIAKTCEIRHEEGNWIVPSQATSGSYKVWLDNFQPKCNCPDYQIRKCKCKHIFAVEFTLEQKVDNKGNMTMIKTMKVSYQQDWSSYDYASINQKLFFLELLSDLTKTIEQPVYTFGRPKIPLQEMVFASVLKVYTTFSLRRFMSDLQTAKEKGYIEHKPCYASVGHFMQKKELTPILRGLVQLSSLALKSVETDFAIDGSGFSTSRFARWFSTRYQKDTVKRKWIKAHIFCGVKTNIITDVMIGSDYSHDTKYLPELLNTTAKNFNIKEVSADKAYSSRNNMNLIEDVGAVPFIPFRKSVTIKTHASGSFMWKKMFHYFIYKQEEFMQHYHKRSNVETCFHMIKSKFGDGIRSKDETAQINEVLAKVLCHNICVVIQEIHELGIKGEFTAKKEVKE
ncbi:MAG TPA: transposase [Candidatus Nanoarchaeia archaeon]|nr:transposase [Candidatus Nanoarchaeia archaeon]